MTKSSEKIGKAAYILLYLFCCSLMSSNKLGGLWGTAGFTPFIYFKLVFAFCAVFTATVILRDFPKFLSKAVMYCTAEAGILFALDYLTLKLSGTMFLYNVWWIAAIAMSALGAFAAGCFTIKKKAFTKFYKSFVYGILPLYIITFIICFLRKPGSNLSTNFVPFHGTFQMLKAFLNNPYGDFEAPLLFFGNVFIFTPLPIILKSCFKNIKDKQLLLAGVLTTIFVEGYQYIFRCGDVDIDDIITNLLGYLLGYFVLKLIERKKLNIK